MYDFILIGAGWYNATLAHILSKDHSVLVIDRRPHIGGNCYTENRHNINIHKYGAHIFHTNNKLVWDFVNTFAEFNRYTNSPLANYNGEIYNLPFNMNTFYKLWGVTTPGQAQEIITKQRLNISEPQNLKEQALSLVGTDIYEKFIRHYTEKQWGRHCSELPSFIIKRLPLRFTYDNNYFNDRYQGIPIGGYTQIFEKLLKGSTVLLDTPYNPQIHKAKTTVYSGAIDEYFGYKLGALEYRSLRFETETLDCENYQGNAVVNYTSAGEPFTRIIEHKHFESSQSPKTITTREYPAAWKRGDEPYYPINDEKNNVLYAQYKELAHSAPNVIFGGRLGTYRYLDMDKVIEEALSLAKELAAH